MKRKVIQTSLAAAAAVAAGFLIAEYVDLRVDRDASRAHVDILAERVSLLRGEVEDLSGQRDQLNRRLTEQETAAEAAEALYRREQDTNQPLRQQIEKMLTAEIEHKAQLAQYTKTVAALTARQADALQQAADLKDELMAARSKLEALQTRQEEFARSNETLQVAARENEAARNVAEERVGLLEDQLNELRSTLAGEEAKVAQIRKERDALHESLEKLKTRMSELQQAQSTPPR